MTVVNFSDNRVLNFDPGNYPESFALSSGVKTEDVSTHIETYTVATDTINLNFRYGDYYDFVSANYQDYEWYELTPVSDDIWDNIISISLVGATRSDFYYYISFYTINIIQFNQVADGYFAFDGDVSWSTDPADFTAYTIKLTVTTETK